MISCATCTKQFSETQTGSEPLAMGCNATIYAHGKQTFIDAAYGSKYDGSSFDATGVAGLPSTGTICDKCLTAVLLTGAKRRGNILTDETMRCVMCDHTFFFETSANIDEPYVSPFDTDVQGVSPDDVEIEEGGPATDGCNAQVFIVNGRMIIQGFTGSKFDSECLEVAPGHDLFKGQCQICEVCIEELVTKGVAKKIGSVLDDKITDPAVRELANT